MSTETRDRAPTAILSAHVLIVDDDPDVLEMTAAILEDAGCVVTGAADGEGALAVLSSPDRVDVMLTDQSMPGLTGVELIARALSLRPGLPCLLLTGYGEIVEPGFPIRVVAKPFRAGSLAEAVAQAVADRFPV